MDEKIAIITDTQTGEIKVFKNNKVPLDTLEEVSKSSRLTLDMVPISFMLAYLIENVAV